MSLVLKPLEINNKGELISLASLQLKDHPYSFTILDHQVGTKESGYTDLLGVTQEGVLALFYFLSSEKELAQIAQSLSNYHWACANILNIKKMYPHAAIDVGASPKMIYVARQFSRQSKKALSFLGIEVEAIQYQAFEVNRVPCLYLELVPLRETKEFLWDLELARLKKEFSGKDALSEEELAEFINFD